MILYPFLIDQVLIRNPRNGTNIVLSRDEARRLADELKDMDMVKFQFQNKDKTVVEAEITRDEAEASGVYDAVCVQRDGKYYTYAGLRKGVFFFNEGTLAVFPK